MDLVKIEVKGLDELINRCNNEYLYGDPIKSFFETITKMLRKSVLERTPRRTGRLQRSVKREIDDAKVPEWGWVYTIKFYGWFLERGTKRGVEARWMFARSEEENSDKVDGLLDKAGRQIGDRWEK